VQSTAIFDAKVLNEFALKLCIWILIVKANYELINPFGVFQHALIND